MSSLFVVDFLLSVSSITRLLLTTIRYSSGSSKVIFRVFYGVILPLRAKMENLGETFSEYVVFKVSFEILLVLASEKGVFWKLWIYVFRVT